MPPKKKSWYRRLKGKFTRNQWIGVIAIIVALIVAVPTIGSFLISYFQFQKGQSISVSVSMLASASVILGPNGSETPGPAPNYGFIFADGASHYPVTIINTGTQTVIIQQILLTTNSSSNNYQIYTVSSDVGALPPNQPLTIPFLVSAEFWQVNTAVKCTFIVTGTNNVEGKATIILYVVANPLA